MHTPARWPTPRWIAVGSHGKALSFDGANDVVRVTNAASLHDQHTFTYCAWVNPRSTGGQRDGRIVHKGTNSARKQLYIDSSGTNDLALYVDRASGFARAISTDNALLNPQHPRHLQRDRRATTLHQRHGSDIPPTHSGSGNDRE